MKKPGMAAVCMAVALFAYAVFVHAEDQSQAGQSGALGQQSGQQQSDQQQFGQQQFDDSSAMSAGSLQQPTWDQQMQKRFIEHAISGNQFEIEASRLAQQKAQDQQVKEFARTLEQDHTQAQERIEQAAQAAGVSDMEKIGPVHQAQLDQLRQLDGAAFDCAYTYTQVGHHSMAVLKYRDASQNAQDPQIKSYASQTLPALRQHLQEAERIAGAEESRTASDIQRPAGQPGQPGAHDAHDQMQPGSPGDAGQ